MSTTSRPRRIGRLIAHTTLAAATTLSMLAIVSVATAPSAAAAVVPPIVGSEDGNHVTADALPTVQIDGVVWDQVVVGNTVYVVGDFDNARPAGAAPGVNQTPRANMLAYNLTTGALIPGFVANLNNQAKTVTASPDGSRIYIGGLFTTVNGASALRIAALNPTTGARISAFNAGTSYLVNDISATNTTVYAGGSFGQAKNQNRARLAAFAASDGSLLPWAPSADATVEAVQLTPDGSRVVVGGHFLNINGTSAYGMGALDPATGAVLPWAANQTIRNGGTDGAILDLSTDGTSIFANGYTFGRQTGNLEGVVKMSATGAIIWVEDCKGDTYAAQPVNGYLYKAGHIHNCNTIGSRGQSDNAHTQWGEWQRHAVSFKDAVAGTIRRDQWSYHNLEGLPAPSATNWAPEWQVGSFTGSNQATWDVDGNAQYVTYGGEFTRVNSLNQQGLVRFAVRGIAPETEGPRLANENFPINVVSQSTGTVRVTFPANFDRDDQTLTYQIQRDGVTVHTTTEDSTFWDQPTVTWLDTGRTPGANHSYRVRASDANDNAQASDPVNVVVASSGALKNYANTVLRDDPRMYWRLGESPGSSTAADSAGIETGAVNAFTFGRPGAILGDTDTAAAPTGSSSRIVQPPLVNRQGLDEANPVEDELSVEAWFRTTSSSGGRILGFGNSRTGTSGATTSDRMLYVSNNGRVLFGVRTRPEGTGVTDTRVNRTIQSNTGLNNGAWHHVVGTLSPDGMALYVDGALVSTRNDVNSGHGYYGYWRVGADVMNSSWTSAPSSTRLNGDIDEAAVYYDALTSAQVSSHWVASGRAGNQNPNAAFSWSADGLTASFNAGASSDVDGTIVSYAWNFGDSTTGTGVSPQKTYATAGTRTVTLTVTDNNGATGTIDQSVTVSAPVPNNPPDAVFSATPTGLSVAFDSSASSDLDGTIVSRAWDFGDGGTSTQVAPNHNYAAAGTYQVTLTVTDDDGDTDIAESDVTVSPPVGDVVLGLDDFTRNWVNGWGTADNGGTWTVSGSATSWSVNGSAGRVAVGVGQTRTATLAPLSQADVDITTDLSFEQAPSGGGVYLSSIARRVGTSEYRMRVKLQPTGANVQLNRVVNGVTTVFASVNVPDVPAAGSVIHLRFRVTGAATTSLSGKVWFGAAPEPAGWTATGTDAAGALQSPGGIGVDTYVTGSSGPMTLLVDRIRAILAD